MHEKSKKREYEQRVRDVDDADFTPLVMSSTGGMGPAMTKAIKHLCTIISERTKEDYSKVVSVFRLKLASSL